MDKSKLIEVLDRNIDQQMLMAKLGSYVFMAVSSGSKISKDEILKILDESINQGQLAKDFASEVIIPMIEAKVKESDNKIDDAIVEAAKKLIQVL